MIRERLIHLLFDVSHRAYGELFKRHRSPWGITTADLLAMPEDRFGHAVGEYLQRQDFSLIPRFEAHDIMHVLTGLGNDARQEIGLQWMLCGNGKRRSYGVLSALIGTLMYPEELPWFIEQFRRGARLPTFHSLPTRELLDLHRDEVMGLLAA